MPKDQRVLGWLDYCVWGDQDIELYVLLTGSFLIPGLGLSTPLFVIIVAHARGSSVIAHFCAAGSDNAIPTMVLPPLARYGCAMSHRHSPLRLIGRRIPLAMAADGYVQASDQVSYSPVHCGTISAAINLSAEQRCSPVTFSRSSRE